MLQTKNSLRKILLPTIIGNALEWYDFGLYGYFAAIIASLFFPTGNHFLSLIKTFGVFAAGFLMRPLGAIIFGHFGDRIGRKKMLAYSVIIMAISTTSIGLLPTHAEIGIWAGILLTICRLLQGFSGGGEYPGSVVFLVEHASVEQRGLWGSLSLFGSGMGFLLGSLLSAVILWLFADTKYYDMAWRIPFLLGSVLGVLGLYLRLHMPETPAFIQLEKRGIFYRFPLMQAFRTQKIAMFKAVFLVFSPLMASYLLFVYLPSYLTLYLNIPLKNTLLTSSVGWLVVILLYPIFGILSDYLGRRLILLAGALTLCLTIYPLFLALQQASFAMVLLVQAAFGFLLAFYYAAVPTVLAEMFDLGSRYSAVAFSQNFAAVLGGTSPIVVTYLIHSSHNIAAPSFYLIFSGLLMLLAILFLEASSKLNGRIMSLKSDT